MTEIILTVFSAILIVGVITLQVDLWEEQEKKEERGVHVNFIKYDEDEED